MSGKGPVVVDHIETTGGSRPSSTAIRGAVEGVRGDVLFQEPLRNHTSFRIGGPADVYVTPVDEEDLARLVVQARSHRVPLFAMGGTNLLVRDGGIRGVVVGLSHLNTIREEGDDVLFAGAGMGMPTLMKYAIDRSLSGLEWATGIPGTVGGCLMMNAGTRLGEMSSAVKGIRLVDEEGTIQDYPASALQFCYRRAIIPPGIVTGVSFQLKPGDHETIATVVKEYLKYRKDTQPLSLPSAGCVFKNPDPKSAGQLIEQAGMKGASIGDAEVSEKHANFIINRGQAKAEEVLELIQRIRSTVEQRTGVTLELELKVVGDP